MLQNSKKYQSKSFNILVSIFQMLIAIFLFDKVNFLCYDYSDLSIWCTFLKNQLL